MNNAVIRAERLTKRFGAVTAVRDVSFEVPRAGIFGLLGPNGSGKSTITRMLCGVLRPSEGTGSVLGVDIRRDPEAIKPRIGYMSQKFSLYPDLSVTENIRFYARVYGVRAIAQREQAVMDLTGLQPYTDRLGRNLSGGWKQRLALACALIHEPEVLFLDEPTAGIDPVSRRSLWDLLFDLSRRGVTLFVTTHYMDEAERCTLVAYLYQSRLIALGRPEELKALPEVNPPGTRRWEVSCADPPAAMARARALPEVKDVTLFGDRLHIMVTDDVAPADLIARLAPGDGNFDFRPIGPSLEDVFVLLSRARDAEAAA